MFTVVAVFSVRRGLRSRSSSVSRMAIRVIEHILCEAYTKAEETIKHAACYAVCVHFSIKHIIQCVLSVRHMFKSEETVEHPTCNAVYVQMSVEDTIHSVLFVRYKHRLRNI
jgi:hypothetical protein